MSAALINRSLTTIRTELEFLHDSEVISEELFNKLTAALPAKYHKDMGTWGLDHLDQNAKSETPSTGSTDKLAQDLEKTKISPAASHERPPAPPHVPSGPKVLSYCEVLYDFQAQESDDLNVHKGDKIAVTEHLSQDWWKGYKKDNSAKIGIFPSNYVKPISQTDFDQSTSEKAEYNPSTQYNSYQQTPQQSPGFAQPGYGGYQSPPAYGQPLQQNPSGNYSQFPPPSTNYYNNQPEPQQQQQQQGQEGQHQVHPHLRKFGGKLGNAAIFGAGATIGSDIVNSIF